MTLLLNKEIDRTFTRFSAAIQNAAIYPNDHPFVVTHIRDTYYLFNALFMKRREICLFLIGENITVDSRPLNLTGKYNTALARILQKNDINRITFMSDLSCHELEELILALGSSHVVAIPSSRHIKLEKIRIIGREAGKHTMDFRKEMMGGEPLEIIDLQSQSMDQMIRNLYQDIIDSSIINVDAVNEIVFQLMNIIRKNVHPMQLLSEVKMSDEYTYIHTTNVGILTMALAEDLGFKGSPVREIGIAAVLHDIGKSMIPDAILSKPGILTSDERKVMETHPVMGGMYLIGKKGLGSLAALAALQHHMKYNGTGYPSRQRKSEPNIVSQIISISDVYDALRTMRPYRGPMENDKIIHIIANESGSSFNPYLVERFIHMIAQ